MYLFIHLFLYSFIRSFIYSFIHLMIYSFIHLIIYLSIHSFIHSFIQSFIWFDYCTDKVGNLWPCILPPESPLRSRRCLSGGGCGFGVPRWHPPGLHSSAGCEWSPARRRKTDSGGFRGFAAPPPPPPPHKIMTDYFFCYPILCENA